MTKQESTAGRTKGETLSLSDFLHEGQSTGIDYYGELVTVIRIVTRDNRVQTIQLRQSAEAVESNREDVEDAIVEAVSKMAFGERKRAKDIAKLADRPCDSYFRGALARLANKKIAKDDRGYGRLS